MKYVLLIPDGMADWRIKELGNRTPLEVADTPNMDFLAREGACGIAATIPKGYEPGSDVANLTILGIDVRKYYTGRGPIEALAKGVKGKIVFRGNLVYVENGIMVDYSGRRIDDEEAREVIDALNDSIKYDFVRFYHGKSYRSLVVIDKDYEDDVTTTPPHDIIGMPIHRYLPKGGKLAELLVEIMEISKKVVPEVTRRANMLWIWGGGRLPRFPKFGEIWNVRSLMISEVDLLKGIGRGLGMDVVDIPGATGYVDTNYRGLVRAVVRGLKKYDFVVLHTEGIDEVSHEGDAEGKVEAISVYDDRIVGRIIDKIDLEETRIMLLPDHPTPVKVRTHVAEPVPFLLYGWKKDDVKEFNEFSCRKGKFGMTDGIRLMRLMFS